MSNKHKLTQKVAVPGQMSKVRHFALSALTMVSLQRESAKMGVELSGAEAAKAVDSLVLNGRFAVRNTVIERRR